MRTENRKTKLAKFARKCSNAGGIIVLVSGVGKLITMDPGMFNSYKNHPDVMNYFQQQANLQAVVEMNRRPDVSKLSPEVQNSLEQALETRKNYKLGLEKTENLLRNELRRLEKTEGFVNYVNRNKTIDYILTGLLGLGGLIGLGGSFAAFKLNPEVILDGELRY